MRLLNTWLVCLLKISFKIRLGIFMLSLLLGIVFVLFSQASGPLLAIPVSLAVWLFKPRGAFVCVGLTVLALAVANSIISRGLFWSGPLQVEFLTGTIALLTEGFFISYLRYLLDLAETAKLQSLQAEQQKLVAYEQQLEAQQAEQRMTTAYEQQRQLNQLKDQFILHVNHELRTPLTSLAGWLEILSLYHESLDSDTLANYLHKATDGCDALIHLVNSILTVAQMNGNVKPSQFEVCSVAQVVREELEQLDPREAEASTLQMDIPEYLTVWANQQNLRQILRNLLSNAVKYSPRHTLVVISAVLENTTAQETDLAPQVSISVKDAGPGIPSSELPLLFEKFVRLRRDVTGVVPGCGLGLYISKQLVEAMGGKIWVESSGRAGEGSRFCFTLPGAAIPLSARTSEKESLSEVVS